MVPFQERIGSSLALEGPEEPKTPGPGQVAVHHRRPLATRELPTSPGLLMSRWNQAEALCVLNT